MSFTDEDLMLHWRKDHADFSEWDNVLVPYDMNLLKYELTEVVTSKSVEEWPEGKIKKE